MASVLSIAARNATVVAISALVDVGDHGQIQIRSGTQPASPDVTATGTLLATLDYPATSYGTPTSGVATAGTIVSDTSTVVGTATWARHIDGAGLAVFDCPVGLTGTGILFDSVTFITGGTAAITTLTITVS